MPTLNWLTRDEDVGAAGRVPYRLLEELPDLSAGDTAAENLLIQGDNLEALKALLPFYAGRVKCIYIDPPYQPGVKVGFLACVRRLVDARSALRQAHEAMASSGLDGFVATSFGYCLQKAASSLRAASM